jgi:two-component system nitrate/nitrite response regulator NarL
VKILAPDIILMDISMPALNGIETTRIIRDIDPTVKVIILTMHDDKEYVLQFMESGARGYVLKKTSPPLLIQAIEAVYRGDVFLSPEISQFVLSEYEKLHLAQHWTQKAELSQRESQVLKLICDGMSSKAIGEKLGISDRTIEKIRANIMVKLNVPNTPALVKFATENGLNK